MKISTHAPQVRQLPGAVRFFLNLLILAAPLFLVELLTYMLLRPSELWSLAFGAVWSVLLSCLVLLLPRNVGRIAYGLIFYVMLAWGLAQSGYYTVFNKMMWLSTISFAGEGGAFLGDVLRDFPILLWIGGAILLILGALLLWKFPHNFSKFQARLPYLLPAALAITGLCLLPEAVFLRDNDVWGTHSEYAQSSSYRATYETMYDASRLYELCGIYHMTFRDAWKNELYPLTPAYKLSQQEEISQIDSYFKNRGDSQDNKMTGKLAGKNVILVLMESIDDWMVTQQDTPTLYGLMNEGISFTNFYTPGFGSARTLNSEFCMNTGIYLPTTGSYVFDYVTNDWSQSIAAQLTANGYSSEVFHYNEPSFYSRGVFEPAMGYNAYNCYADYESDKNRLYDDCLLFDIPELSRLLFREGPSFSTIITRSAHLSYKYNEVLSNYALKQYPEYQGLYASEEEDCARVKAKLVDDMFARLLQELERHGQLENTVIIGMTDHYTYGYKNIPELLAHSQVDSELLLEKTPCFIWSAGLTGTQVDKTLNTADLVPTVLNLLGIDSPYHYLGQDAFDPSYEGYAIFPDGSWASQGIVCQMSGNTPKILLNENNLTVTDEMLKSMSATARSFIRISNLLLTSDYYKEIR